MPTLTKCILLNDGVSMPILGFGTSDVNATANDLTSPDCQAIIHAIKCGYRFIDTAARYKNEEGVGLAIKYCVREGYVRREDLFVCTKVWCTAHKRESVMKSCKDSLRRLGLDYVDMLLVHWPMGFDEDGDPDSPTDPKTGAVLYSDVPITETWRGFEDCRDAGLAKSIGVSNFNHKMIEELFAMCKHQPVVNQVECHVYLNQAKLQQFSRRNRIVLMAYCPLGSPGNSWKPGQPLVLEDPTVAKMAKKYEKTPAQILIRFLIQRDMAPIPKSITKKRIEENFNVFDFTLEERDLSELLSLNKNLRYCVTTGGFDCKDHPLYPFNEEF